MRRICSFVLALVICSIFSGILFAQTPAPKPVTKAKADLSKPSVYVVGYAHLDTEWRWEYPLVIREYLSKTMRNNFALFEKYPDYIFNFSGANRYRLMKEYYPEDYKRLQHYVAAGRWFPAGSSMEESDVNSPSAESIFRQVLYGNEFFRRDFGKASSEYMLPDCFGFPASLPSILAHAGVKGFSTQKLTWGSSADAGGWDSPERTPMGTPFNVGLWEGPDGKSVIAAFNPGSYAADLSTDLTKPLPEGTRSTRGKTEEAHQLWLFQDDWARRVARNGEVTGLFTDYHYFGTGDIGGSATERSVQLLEAMLHKRPFALPAYTGQEQWTTFGKEALVGDGPVRVISATADQMFLDIGNNTAKLPRYKGELELTNHSAGSLTSEAYQKRWNRKNELLADAAEKASVAAAWLGGRVYPQKRLNDAWTLVMGGQFHDIMAGTATPQSYNYSWNDDVIAMNQFAGVMQDAVGTVAAAMDTRGDGIPIVVYNPLNVSREDLVEATTLLGDGDARVIGPDGNEVPSQRDGNKVVFAAKVPSVGFAVYHVQSGGNSLSELKVTESSLENARYRVQIDANGDVSSIFDKKLNRELLSAPARLAFLTENPAQWPAWNMDYEDQMRPPRAYVSGPAKVRIAERGPARVALEIEREAEGSKFVQTIRLSAGDAGNRVEFTNEIDWQTKESALKAVFPLAFSNENATYNWDVGTIERPTNTPKKFEVPSHQWFDLTDRSGNGGVTILSDCKYGSDKPDDHTLRLTLIYSPGLGGKQSDYADQTTQDFGHHQIVYGLSAHDGDWRKARTDWQGYRLNQPLIAFVVPQHEGALGKQFSLVSVDNPSIRVLALKKAENSGDIVVRLVETDGRDTKNVHTKFASAISSARELNGQEQPLGAVSVSNGSLETSFTPYQLHTIAVKLAPSTAHVAPAKWQAVALNYDTSVASFEGKPAEGCMDCSWNEPAADGQGHAYPAEMLPASIAFQGVEFRIAPSGKNDAVIARGQAISLPVGDFTRAYVLASAIGDQSAKFRGVMQAFKIPDWTGFVGQWDNRKWNIRKETVPAKGNDPEYVRTVMDFTGKITPGFIKRADIAWYASHRHDTNGSNEPYSYSYLFAIPIDFPPGTETLTLPNNDKVRILAITVTSDHAAARPVQPLYDTLEH
ncbi:glycosyl hydrolases 38-like protein [Candidatus Koribacter versatilis Ellin345]|uniref:Glycosyl hydrolases 38-like protein n=1 Tax=Koribacter versatilis (strain Ellin345) TaxID=204669 RepID=Q1ILX7_KORVE|nr:alpha-mannosidase [Candidatus Koribacter versatilis]ABF42123.1 glycosyl hydrolases 38-like protein [Candidatus Koribacter versatilis Ellin345]